MFSCQSCGSTFKTLKGYADHQKLHKNEANYMFVCCVTDCKAKFAKFSAFKTHIYRKHQKRQDLGECGLSQYKCDQPYCQQSCLDQKDLLVHLKSHIVKGETVTCPFKGCGKTFQVKSSFTAHISRQHKRSTQISPAVTCDLTQSASVNEVIESHDALLDEYTETSPNVGELYLRNLSMFLMKLQVKCLIPSSTIKLIVEEMGDLNCTSQLYNRKILETSLRTRTTLSEAEILSILKDLDMADLHSTASTALATEHTRQQYYQRFFDYVHPLPIYLGTDENRKQRYEQYIPIKDTLHVLLKNPTVLEECTKFIPSSLGTETLNDVCDGSAFKFNAKSVESDTIKLILYQDAFEIVNPLGAAKRKHKIVGVYYSLANLDPFYRSRIDSIQLLLMCYEKDLKYFGQEKVFSRLVADLKTLEENGLTASSGHVFKAIVCCITGDNLGSHMIGGFTENFSSSRYFCRYCVGQRDKLVSFGDCGPVRTVEHYKNAVKCLKETDVAEVQGVKFDSVFNSLRHFHVCQPGLPPCLGHDLFEGVVAYDLAIFLKYFAKKVKWFSYTHLNRRLAQFPFKGSDASSAPCTVAASCNKIAGQAVQNWNLLRMLPLVIGDKVADPDDGVWRLVIQLKEIVELVCAPQISVSQVAYLDVLIKEYLESRQALFSSLPLKPKHHFLAHYPSLILKFGPLIRLWTMRFESKHSYFKRCMRRFQNFKNVCQTLARSHQLLQAYLNASSLFPSILEVKNGSPLCAELYNGAVQDTINACSFTSDSVSVSVEVCFKGTVYKRGLFLCLGCDSEASLASMNFGQIELVLIERNAHVSFLVSLYRSQYLPHFGVYDLEQISYGMKCVNIQDLPDFYPLPAYDLYQRKLISLKHSVAF